MKNIYGDNVSWFCYEGSINLQENRCAKTFTLDDEFEVYGENEQGQEGSGSVCVVSLLESAHVSIDEKDAQIKKLTEALDMCESSMTIAMIGTGFDFELELNSISDLLAEIKGENNA